MSKKLKKLLFLSAVIGSAVGAACYFARKKQEEPEEEDYDDFSDDTDSESSDTNGYVSLTPETAAGENQENPETATAESVQEKEDTPLEESTAKENGFTPLAEQVAQSKEKVEETVEEFFDEDDSSGTEPPIRDN